MQGQECEYYSSKVFLQFHTLSALSFSSIYNYHVCKNYCVYYISINILKQAIIFQKKLSSVYLSVPSRQKKILFQFFSIQQRIIYDFYVLQKGLLFLQLQHYISSVILYTERKIQIPCNTV